MFWLKNASASVSTVRQASPAPLLNANEADGGLLASGLNAWTNVLVEERQ